MSCFDKFTTKYSEYYYVNYRSKVEPMSSTKNLNKPMLNFIKIGTEVSRESVTDWHTELPTFKFVLIDTSMD